jgi:MtN3 and saliva related transmembrane protein
LAAKRRLVLSWQEFLGFVSGAIMTSSMIPQVWKLFKLRSAREISLPFTLLFLIGTICWLSYGIVLSLTPVILWNAVTMVSALAMVYAKFKFNRK